MKQFFIIHILTRNKFLILKIIGIILIFILGISVAKKITRSFDERFVLKKNDVLVKQEPPTSWKSTVGVYDEHLDHFIYYNNFYNVIEKVKNIDVLIIGNSQSLFGFEYQIIEPFSKSKNISIYNMAFGHDENYKFPLEIIKKFNIKPKYIFADAWIFKRSTISSFGQKVINTNYFESFKSVFEDTMSYKSAYMIHKYVPKISFVEPKKKKISILRSLENGSYFLEPISKTETSSFDAINKNPFQPNLYKDEDLLQLSQAKEFKEYLDSINTKLVLFSIPGRGYMPYRPFVEKLAKKIGAETILPEIKSGTYFDGRHLSEISAIEYTKKFIEEIDKKDFFK